MRKILVCLATTILLFLSGHTSTLAVEPDLRIEQMRAVLTKYNSPMLGLEEILIATAEKYKLDWTLMAAIAGTESSFGKRMPVSPTGGPCINPYGWGIYGDHKLCFSTFEAAIEGVASGLAKKYNISSLESIARTYNIVSTEGWISHTRFFMHKIQAAEIPVHALPITL
ncbi:MAG: hypothetical protein V1487_01470 [bacterium]